MKYSFKSLIDIFTLLLNFCSIHNLMLTMDESATLALARHPLRARAANTERAREWPTRKQVIH